MDSKEIQENILKTLPSWITIVFGDPVSKIAGGMSLLAEGWAIQRERNKDWWDKYLEAWEIVETIQEQIKQPEYIQFIREVITNVTFETREAKRQYLLNIARNYHLKHEVVSFDKKMLFLNILENMSEAEVIYVLEFYGKIDIAIIRMREEDDQKIKAKLASTGLIEQDFTQIQENFEKMSDDLEKTSEALNDYVNEVKESIKGDRSFPISKPDIRRLQDYNKFIDRFEVKYRPTLLGEQFVNFVIGNGDKSKQPQGLSEFF